MRAAALALVLALLAAACSPETPTSEQEEVTPTSTTVQSSPATEPEVPAEPAGVQAGIDWFIEVLNGVDLDESEYESRFADAFRTQVAFDSFLQVIDGLRRRAPYALVERNGSDAVGYAIVESEDGTRYRVSGQLDAGGRFEGLLISPESFPEMANPPASVGESFELLGQISRFGGIAAEITDGECSVLASIGAEELIPLGSAFKLYVLGALALQIDAGEIMWDEELVITERIKSIPTGTLQDRPSGSVVSVREAAELMISISDNTAADLLIRRLGRETIEASQGELGMSDPEANAPFLTTLEFAVLKLAVDDATRRAYITGDEIERRRILDEISDVGVEDVPVLEFVQPVNPDSIEWFATPSDLCRLAIGLWGLSERPGLEPVGDILSLNPGVPDGDGRWNRIWFKGGSEPGLLAIWWLVESAEGQRFVLAGSNVDPDANIDADRAILVWAAGRNVLGQSPG